ncbi:MAG: class I SAM-dependent methyltransferase [Methanoregula sp.]|nr:class I SAM-dependent methyltransferase [Methanoregula sp.]
MSLFEFFKDFKRKIKRQMNGKCGNSNGENQDLDPYWDEEFADSLENWGEGNVWDEIQFLLVGREGRVLDIACGTGKTIDLLSKYPNLTIYGCDISDFLIKKAISKGIREEFLDICDATHTNYETNFFDFSYSIGSLEHFTSDGISQCINESYRVTKKISFHMVPVSKKEKDEGWTKTIQGFHNNSTDWWFKKFSESYLTVYILNSKWQDNISKGKWFVCIKEGVNIA